MASFTFNTPQTTTANTGGFAFGGLNTSAIGAPQATQPQAAPAFGFGTPVASAAPTAVAAPTPALSFGLSAPPYGAQAISSAPTLGFGLGTTTTSAPAAGLTFGATPAATSIQSTLPAFGGFQASTAAAAAAAAAAAPSLLSTTNRPSIGLGFGLTTTTTTTTLASNVPQKVGLGGIDVNAAQPKTIEGQVDSSKVKENQLPQEIICTVDALKAYTNQQKTLSSDIVRTSSRKIKNINSELNALNWSLADIHTNVEANFIGIKQLRNETNKGRQEAEIAQRTHETPAGLQFENIAPLHYFMDLVQKFENDMLTIRKQLELTETHIRSLTNPQAFTADDLKKGLQQIHECFVALAGRLQETHRTVENQNEHFRNVMKHRGRDKALDSFHDGASSTADYASLPFQIASGYRAIIPNVACGPTPFSAIGIEPYSSLSRLSATSGGPATVTAPPTAATAPGSFGGQPTAGTSAMFGAQQPPNPAPFGSFFGDKSGFGLGQSPVATKRSK